MPARKKSLHELVRDGTFVRRRHKQLLEDSPLLADGLLRKLQTAYRLKESELERDAIALEFQKAVQETAGERRAGAGDRLQAELAKLGPPGSAQRVINFFPRFYRLEDGQPFRLEAEQVAFTEDFWTRDRHGLRVFKFGLLGIPRGCGKTPLASGYSTCELVSTPRRPRIFQVAGSKDQAKIGLEYAEAWATEGPLAEWLSPRAGRLKCTANGGEYRVLSSDGRLAHGRRPRAGVVDEWWMFDTYRERQTFTALSTALHKIRDSWLLAITTAGYDSTSQLGEAFSQALQLPGVEVLRGGCLTIVRDKESGFLMHWYGAPEDADIENPAVLRACNPGSWVDVDELLRELNRPGTDELEWRRLHANQWTAVKGAWLPTGCWAGLKTDEEIPDGAPIYVAVDAALTYDTTAVVWAWRSESGRVILRSHVWSTRRDAQADVTVDADELDNEALVEPFVYELANRYRVREVAYDPRFFGAEAKHLSAAGLTVIPMHPQSAPAIEATQEFYKAAISGKLGHKGDPVLTGHVNATAAVKTEGGWRVYKLKASRPIDATSAAIMANGRALAATGESVPSFSVIV